MLVQVWVSGGVALILCIFIVAIVSDRAAVPAVAIALIGRRFLL